MLTSGNSTYLWEVCGDQQKEIPILKAIALDKQGNLFILGGDLSENINRDVYVLSKDNELITTFTLSEASWTIHIDRNNFLYSRSEDGKKLTK